MRRLIQASLLAAIIVPTAAYADPPAAHRAELRQDRREVQRDVRRGDHREAREDRRELREDRREFRNDHRDAWRDYRTRNRAVFHRPDYVGPRGYRYQQWRPGWRLPQAYYGARYVIADPWHYRLYRPAAGYQRWVRYGNDVLLVDIRSGIIRDVIRDFFW